MTQHSALSTQHSPQARTPLHQWQVQQNAQFRPRDHWQVPTGYSSVEHEVQAARDNAGLVDLSALAKFSVIGKDVAAAVDLLAPQTPLMRLLGATTQSLFEQRITGCRLSEEHLLLLASTTASSSFIDQLGSRLSGLAVVQNDVTTALGGFCVLGPRMEELLRQLTPLDVRARTFLPGTCAETNLAGAHAILARLPEGALPSMRVYVGWDLGEYVWERLMAAGRALGAVPLGMDAWDQLTR